MCTVALTNSAWRPPPWDPGCFFQKKNLMWGQCSAVGCTATHMTQFLEQHKPHHSSHLAKQFQLLFAVSMDCESLAAPTFLTGTRRSGKRLCVATPQAASVKTYLVCGSTGSSANCLLGSFALTHAELIETGNTVEEHRQIMALPASLNRSRSISQMYFN